MRHIVSTKVLQTILDYLANRPYSEVAALIKMLQEDARPLEEDKTSE